MYLEVDHESLKIPIGKIAKRPTEVFWAKYVRKIIPGSDLVRWDRFEEGCHAFFLDNLIQEASLLAKESPIAEINLLLVGLYSMLGQNDKTARPRDCREDILRPGGVNFFTGRTVSRANLDEMVGDQSIKQFFLETIKKTLKFLSLV